MQTMNMPSYATAASARDIASSVVLVLEAMLCSTDVACVAACRKSATRRAHIRQLRGGLAESETDSAWLASEAVRLQAKLDASLLRRSELLDAITCAAL